RRSSDLSNITQANRGAEMVTIGAGGDAADDSVARPDRLVVIEQRLGIGQPELQQPACQSLLLLAQHGIAPEEIAEAAARLVRFRGKAEAGFEHMVLIADVVAEMPIGFFDAA